LVFQTKKQMEELKDKITPDIRSKLETEIKKVEDAVASNNSDQIKNATESLSKAWNDIAAGLYSQSGGAQQGPQQQQTAGQEQNKKEDKDNVQDASYEVVDDDEEKKKKN